MTAEAFSGSAVAAVVTVVTTTAEDTLKGISSVVVVEHFGDYNSGQVCLVPPWPVFLITSPAHPWLRVCYVCRACSWGAGGALRELAETSSRNRVLSGVTSAGSFQPSRNFDAHNTRFSVDTTAPPAAGGRGRNASVFPCFAAATPTGQQQQRLNQPGRQPIGSFRGCSGKPHPAAARDGSFWHRPAAGQGGHNLKADQDCKPHSSRVGTPAIED